MTPGHAIEQGRRRREQLSFFFLPRVSGQVKPSHSIFCKIIAQYFLSERSCFVQWKTSEMWEKMAEESVASGKSGRERKKVPLPPSNMLHPDGHLFYPATSLFLLLLRSVFFCRSASRWKRRKKAGEAFHCGFPLLSYPSDLSLRAGRKAEKEIETPSSPLPRTVIPPTNA